MVRSTLLPSVLIAEDNEMIRNLLSFKLSGEFRVEACADGGEALACVDETVDVLVADVHMPFLGGFDLIRAIQKRGLRVPTILITGSPTLESAQVAIEEGVFRYVSKPIDLDKLTNLVRLATRIHQADVGVDGESSTHHACQLDGIDLAEQNYSLDEALDSLWLALQPIRDTGRNCLLGYEALVRTEVRELDSPSRLLKSARMLGRLPEVGRRVRSAAIEALSCLPNDSVLFLNLLAEDLDDPDLFRFDSPLSRYAERIVFELTEHRGWPDHSILRQKMEKLRALGYRIALDDLGAGQNGLARFCSLVPDLVKIDRCLIHNINRSAMRLDFVRALARICRRSNITVIAEGVEDEREYAALRSVNCDIMQGYLFGRPERFQPMGL